MTEQHFRHEPPDCCLVLNPTGVADPCWASAGLSLAPDSLAEHAEALPRLAAYGMLDAEHRAALDARPLIVVAKAYSEATPEETAAHLKQQMMARNPLGQRYFLRMHDPRIFRHLPECLTAGQMSRLLGPITAWHYREEPGWSVYQRPGRPARTGGLHLKPSQFSRLQRIGQINQVQQQLDQMTGQAATIEHIDRWLVFAARQGLRAQEDRVAFAVHGLTKHPDFHAHPLFQAVLTRSSEPEFSYRLATLELDESDWQRISHDMDRRRAASRG
ncbi:MAG: hypothetical protein CMN28_07275 [Salinisphaeraceae bacterium]|nr:hypothetical protein [Salinisphaeraceae bacterium]